MKSTVIFSVLTALFTALPALAAPTQAPTPAETCGKLQEMLVDTQAAQPSWNALEYAVIDRGLKRKFVSLCEAEGVASPQRQGRDSGGRDGDSLAYGPGQPLWENGRWFLPNGKEFADSLLQDAAAQAPILGPFLAAHRRCAPGCGYVSWGIWGDKSHQQRRSCHNSGQAIDIHAITCGGTHKALSARFDQYVSCMRGSLGVIYRSANHFSHAHFQLHGCNMCSGLGCGKGKVPSQPRPAPGDDEEDDSGQDEDSGQDDEGDEEEEE